MEIFLNIIWDQLMALYWMEVALGKFSLLFSTDRIHRHLLKNNSLAIIFVIFIVYLFTQNFRTSQLFEIIKI